MTNDFQDTDFSVQQAAREKPLVSQKPSSLE